MAKKSKTQSGKNIVDYSIRKKMLKRNHRAGFMLNDKEQEAVDAYCKKHKIDNKSKFMRETVIRYVMEHFLTDYPTLFEKHDLDKLKV